MQAWPANTGGSAQHVSIVGPTGQGKSVLGLSLISERARVRDAHVVVLATKPRDATLSRMALDPDWHVIRSWPPGYGQKRVIFWPKFGDVKSVRRRHSAVFDDVLADIFHERNRVVYMDEASYLSDDLGLTERLRQFWQMGRSQNVIVVAGTQRPVKVPRPMFSECSFFFAFRTADEDELRRVSEIGGTDTRLLREIMRAMPPHEFVVVQTRTGKMVRSRVEL